MRGKPMKSIYDQKRYFLGTATMPLEIGRHIVSHDLKERVETDAVLSAGFLTIIALCAAMVVGLYNWTRYAPVFSPDDGGVPAVEESIPWSR
jgi:hypothetical protein